MTSIRREIGARFRKLRRSREVLSRLLSLIVVSGLIGASIPLHPPGEGAAFGGQAGRRPPPT